MYIITFLTFLQFSTMKYQWNTLIYNTYRNIFVETRRYAGHSKWKNIKATKQAQDSEKSAIFRNLAIKMKSVIKGNYILHVKKINEK